MTPLQAVRKHREVVAGLLATAGVAWWLTVERMGGMDAGPGTDLGALGWFTASAFPRAKRGRRARDDRPGLPSTQGWDIVESGRLRPLD